MCIKIFFGPFLLMLHLDDFLFLSVTNITKLERLHVCLFVVTPTLPRDGGTAGTAIQVHALNLIEIRLGERWQPISNQS